MGYCESDASLVGSSHMLLSGTGCGDMLDVLLIPNVGEVKWVPGTRENPSKGHRAPFRHADEQMEAGAYAVPLHDRGVFAGFTATESTGLHRYCFPASTESHFILDFEHPCDDPANPVSDADLEIVGNDTFKRSDRLWVSEVRSHAAAASYSS